jgi:ABC-type iron transport system FetAB ATPase subunit
VQPELLSGTLRQNLDPFGQFEDTELTQALRAAGLYSLQTEGAENNITFVTNISAGGSNLSVGERQVIALARAMIRQRKLLILDEGTPRQPCSQPINIHIRFSATSAIGIFASVSLRMPLTKPDRLQDRRRRPKFPPY